jgi:8-oxo-dGTP pyrophosphatase MutT (NUDIX family)
MQLYTVGLLAIKNRKLLLAYSKNKQCYYLPGGKPEPGETPLQALLREIAEELNMTLKEDDLEFYTHISAAAYGEKEGTVMEQDCYLLQVPIRPVASAEIASIRYFSRAAYEAEAARAPGAVLILERLAKDGLID